MLGLDPEGPVPLDIIKNLPVSHALHAWESHRHCLPVSGDPHFSRAVSE